MSAQAWSELRTRGLDYLCWPASHGNKIIYILSIPGFGGSGAIYLKCPGFSRLLLSWAGIIESKQARTISTTSRLYIGLAVRLYVFINTSLISLMFKLLYLCRERPGQESNWTDSLVSSLSIWLCNMILHKRSYALWLSFEKLHYFTFHRTLSDQGRIKEERGMQLHYLAT